MSNQIYCTKEYNIFKALEGNRGNSKLNEAHLSRLEKSILEENLLKSRPIMVNKDMVIIDGHHRLEVAKRNAWDIYYVIEPEANYKSAMRLTRGTTPWTIKSYMECQTLYGDPQFAELARFLEKNNVSLHNFLRIYSKSGRCQRHISKIKDGTFTFNRDINELEPFIEKINRLINILINEFGIKKYKIDRTEFWFGCYKFLTKFESDWEAFENKLRKNFTRLSNKYGCWKSMATSLASIYNLGIHKGYIDCEGFN